MKINNRLGYHLPGPFRIVGFILMIGGVYGSLIGLNGILGGVICIIAGIFLAFSAYGITINTKNKQVKPYQAFLGFRFGKWMDASTFKKMVVYPETKIYTVFSRANLSTSMRETKYCICIYDSDADEEFLIKKIMSKEKADKYAEWFRKIWCGEESYA